VAGRRHERDSLGGLDRREGSVKNDIKEMGCEEVNRIALLDEAVVVKLLNVEGLKYVQAHL
jgi:hypothetical protein